MQNATALFLEGEMKNGLLRDLEASLKRAFPYEDECEISDHAAEAVAVWIRRDSFAQYLGMGQPPRRNLLKAWARQVAANVIRDRGGDALHRQLRGARTGWERRNGGLAPWAHSEGKFVEVLAGQDESTGELETDMVDMTAGDALDLLHGKDVEAAVARALKASCPRSTDAGERLAGMSKMMVDGASKKEIGERYGVTPLRVAHLTQRVRDNLRQAEDEAKTALRAMEVLFEEPFSTEEEITLTLGTSVSEVLENLKTLGLVETTSCGRSFRLTKRGVTRLEEKGTLALLSF
jgi:hypothetical protein